MISVDELVCNVCNNPLHFFTMIQSTLAHVPVAAPAPRHPCCCRVTCRAAAVPLRAGDGALSDFDPQPILFTTKAPLLRVGRRPSTAAAPAGATQAAPAPSVAPLVTLATQVSLDRWPAFSRQAAAWGGPASVAVYCPCPAGDPSAEAAERLVFSLAQHYSEQHPHQDLVVSMLYAKHYAREGASALPQVCRAGV